MERRPRAEEGVVTGRAFRAGLLMGLCALGCGPGPAEKVPPRAPRWGAAAVIQAPCSLLPVRRRAGGERPAAQDVWRGLPEAFARDRETRDLLKKLLAAEDVQAVAFSRSPGSDFRPEGGPFASSRAFLALWPSNIRPEKDHLKNLPDFYAVGLGYAYFQGEPAPLGNGSDHLRAVVLAINDHLLRQDSGHALLHGNVLGDDAVREKAVRLTSGPPAELRADLDRDIADFIKAHKPE